MDVFLAFHIVLIMLLGIITTYTDVSQGKIRNRHLLVFLVCGILLLIAGQIQDGSISASSEAVANLSLAALVAVLLWYAGLWTSADAKLFWVFVLLIPVEIYQNGYIPFFPAMSLLLNVFIPFLVFYLFRLLIYTSSRQKLGALKKSIEPGMIFSLMLSVFVFMWAFDLLSMLFWQSPKVSLLLENFFVRILLLALVFSAIQRVSGMGFTVVAIVLSAMRFALDRSIYSASFLIQFILICLLFIFTRYFLLQLSDSVYITHRDIHLLKPGQMLAENIYRKGDKYYKQSTLRFSLYSYISSEKRQKPIFELDGNGLTREQVILIKKLGREGKLSFSHIAAYQTLAFAPFLFAGVIITLAVSGSFIHFLAKFI